MALWNSAINYSSSDTASFGGVAYMSLQNSNTNHQPDLTIGTWWDYAEAVSKLTSFEPLYPNLQATKLTSYTPLFPFENMIKLVAYIPLYPGIGVSKAVAYVVLFPTFIKRPFVQPVTSA